MTQNPYLIAADDLADVIGRDGVSIVDASWYLPAQGRFARAEYEAGHVPDAIFFDQDEIVDPGSSLPHALPSPEIFAEKVGKLGIRETDTIVVYDGMGLFSAPRVWWMFRTFGAKDVRILDGGYPAWVEGDHPVEMASPEVRDRVFTAHFDRDAVASFAQMQALVSDGGRRIVDVRPADRFSGSVAEPRPGVRSGHMPGAANLPFTQVQNDGRLKGADELRAVLTEAGLDPEAAAVTSCGSGVTAAILNLTYATLGNHDVKLYDGSWSEWGAAPDTPVDRLP